MVRFKKNNKAVSEVLGTILLLVISVSLFSVIYASFFAIDVTPNTPSVNIVGAIKQDSLILEHCGGESLSLGTKVLLDFTPDGSTRKSVIIDEENYLELDEKQDGEWNIGEDFSLVLSNIPEYQEFNPVGIMVVDVVSDSVVMYGTLQGTMQQVLSADLGVNSLVCNPSAVSTSGSIISVSFTVLNFNEKPANGFNYSISVDGTEKDPVSHNLDPALEMSMESGVITEPITLPNDPPLNGISYEIKLEIFIDGTVYADDGDTNKANNIKTSFVELNEIDPNADLVMSLSCNPIYPDIRTAYEIITITAEVTNNGPSFTDNVEVRCKLPAGVRYVSNISTQGLYDNDTGIWTIGYIEAGETASLNIRAVAELLAEELPFTQLAILLDGSSSIPVEEFQMIVKSLSNAVRDGSIPHVGRIELTVFQMGLNYPYDYPYQVPFIEVGPVILNNIPGSPGYYLDVSEEIEGIQQIGGFTPLPACIQGMTDILKASPNFNPDYHQIIDFVTDGYPNLKLFQKYPTIVNCYEIDGGIICEINDDFDVDLPDLESLNDVDILIDYLISGLEMTEDQDEINCLVVDGLHGNNFGWFKDHVSWPQPGYDNWPPTDSGWARLVDTHLKVGESLAYQVNYEFVGRVITAIIINSDHPDPNPDNNIATVTVTPMLKNV